MDLIPFWIFTREQLAEINESRNSNYAKLLQSKQKELQQEGIQFDDRVIQRFYLKNLIKIVRSRKSSQADQQFFITEKILQTTVYLFKRYYLVNHFINEQPHQIIMCALYMALKIQEMPMKSVLMMAEALKTKAYWKQLKPVHFGMNGYTDFELQFLEAINFEINKISMVRPIESLLNRIKSINTDVVKRLDTEKEVSKLIQMVYFSDLFWVVHPAKLALCIILVALEGDKCQGDIQSIDNNGDIKNIVKANKEEIDYLVGQLRGLKPYNRKENKQNEKFQRYRSWTREFFRKPSLKRKNDSINGIPLN